MVHSWGVGSQLRQHMRFRQRISKTSFWKRADVQQRNNLIYIDNDSEYQTMRPSGPILGTLRRQNKRRKANFRRRRRRRKPLVESISIELAKEEEQFRDMPGISITDTTSISQLEDEETYLNVSKKRFSRKKKSPRTPVVVVRNAEELRAAVLDQKIALENIEFDSPCLAKPTEDKNQLSCDKTEVLDLPFDHEVLKIIEQRFKSNSKPGFRAANDTARLALSIEGGGMRGAVSAGMASAIACLGLCDSFDQIYGSSAGSIIGAYMVSRQMCVDVYTDVLTASKTAFVSKSRLISWIAGSLVDQIVDKTLSTTSVLGDRIKSPQIAHKLKPAMNTSFVIDNVLCPEYGLRPLDLPVFKENDKLQPLIIVSSAVREGKMETISFSSKEKDFFDEIDEKNGMITDYATTSIDGKRHGIFACLDASMTVPAAAGPPLKLIRNKDCEAGTTSTCFDAFCFEPIPYRSAVQDGATHVLVLKSRPDGSPIGTKPKAYEKTIAPLYFNSNNLTESSDFFKVGGQQYMYVEDYLTLDEGKNNDARNHRDGVPVPPTKILYGGQEDEDTDSLLKNRANWNKAHLLPLSCPKGTRELSNLSLDKDEVLEAVRGGFSAAFDLLAPSAGVKLDCQMNSTRVAELIFPNKFSTENMIGRSVIPGFPIVETQNIEKKKRLERCRRWISHRKSVLLQKLRRRRNKLNESEIGEENNVMENDSLVQQIAVECSLDPSVRNDAHKLLISLPGLKSGKFSNISKGLQYSKGQV